MRALIIFLLLLCACGTSYTPFTVEQHIKKHFYTEDIAVNCIYVSNGIYHCQAANGNKFVCNTENGIGCIPTGSDCVPAEFR